MISLRSPISNGLHFCSLSIILLAHLALVPAHAAVAEGASTFYRVLRAGDDAGLARLLRDGADVNALDAEGNRPLHYACFFRQAPAVRTLLAHGASVHGTNRAG